MSNEYPKWIEPHPSHIVHQGDSISTPAWPECHVTRDGKLSVLVADKDDEARALADANATVEKLEEKEG